MRDRVDKAEARADKSDAKVDLLLEEIRDLRTQLKNQ